MMEKLNEKNLNGYELIERIGAGGFGAVYKAYQSTIGREVAIKFILPGFANHPDFIRRFETEAHVIARLEHPYIVPLYDYWRDPDGAYLVMRWLRGGSLREKLKQNGALTVEEANTILTHICSGLELAHRHDVIHRDIKPGNILLDEDGNAYLADFGIAKDLTNYDTNHTGIDEIVGSLDYLSPEQARSEPVSPATDVYSLGVMLFEMLAGQHPFYGSFAVELLYKHINDPLPELTVLDLTIRNTVNDVIQRATKKDPAERYQDVLSFATDFRMAINATDHLATSLTQREYDVLHRIVNGLSNQQIADELFIAISTVKTYVNQIYKKLGVRTRVQATIRTHELNLLSAGVGQEIPSLSSSHLPEPENPYKGLQAFEAHDSRDFFGRENLVEKLIEKMQDGQANQRFLAVIGPSGSGKSSLVKGGLIPAIWNGQIPGSDRWFTLEMMPGDHPMEELEVALTRISANQVANLNEHLRRDNRGLLRASKLILPTDDTGLLIVIDQFEELFTHVDDEDERQHFLDILYTAATDSRSHIRIIVTLRADFYDRPLHYPDFGDLLRSRMETILPLSAKELHHAIEKPAERVLVTFEEGLIAHIVSEMNYQSGALPLLQYALTELFEHRQGRLLTLEAYQAIGGAVGALTQRAESLYEELTAEEQRITQQMFLRLVTPGEGTGDTRRRVPCSELLAISEQPGIMDDLIDLFAEHRMLSLDHDLVTRSPTVEVAHESILGQWERLLNWINQNREEIKMQQQISHLTEEWHNANQDPSYLVRGLRLDQMLDWAEHTNLALTETEREFLATSLSHRNQRKQMEESRKEREIDLERRSVQNLRALVITFVIASIVSTLFAVVAFTQRKTAEDARATSESIAQLAQQQSNEIQSLFLANVAEDASDNGDDFLAQAIAVEAVRADNTSELANQELNQIVSQLSPVRLLEGHTDDVSTVAFSSDGNTAVSGSFDNTLILWDIATGDIIRRFEGHTDRVTDVVFNSDDTIIVSASADMTQILWDVASADIIRRFEGHSDIIQSVAMSSDGQYLLSSACASKDRNGNCTGAEIILWELASGTILNTVEAHENQVFTLNFVGDTVQVLSMSNSSVILWQINNNALEQFRPLFTDFRGFKDVAYNPADTTFYATLSNGTLVSQSLDSETAETVFEGDSRVSVAAFSPDFRQFATIEDDSLVLTIGEEPVQVRFNGLSDRVRTLAFSPDSQTLISGSNDGTLLLWDTNPSILRSFEHENNIAWALAISPDASIIVAGGGILGGGSSIDPAANSLIMWNVATGEVIHRLEAHISVTVDAAFSPDGQLLASASRDGTIAIWDVTSGNLINRFDHLPSDYVAFIGDGRTAIASGREERPVLWDVNTGNVIRTYTESPLISNLGGSTGAASEIYPFSFAISPDEETLAVAHSNFLILWDIESGEEIQRIDGFLSRTFNMSFSPDGHLIAIVSAFTGVIVIDVRSGEIVHHLEEYDTGDENQNWSGDVEFSPDGQNLLSIWQGGTVVMWNIETGQTSYLGKQNGEWGRVTFTSSGIPVSSSWDGTVIMWNLPDTDILNWVEENRYIREFTCDEHETYRIEPYCTDE